MPFTFKKDDEANVTINSGAALNVALGKGEACHQFKTQFETWHLRLSEPSIRHQQNEASRAWLAQAAVVQSSVSGERMEAWGLLPKIQT